MSEELKDVTAIFDHYRISAREVWNTAFWPDPDLREWDFVDAFDDIQRILFDSLVLSKVDEEFPAEQMFRKPILYFHVTPQSGRCSIMIQNPRGANMTGYWDDPVKEIAAEGSEMHFIDFFDWSRMTTIDFRYYRVSIARFDEHPHLVGREALIETFYANVLYADEPELS